MNKKLFIFDLDGTLVDAYPAIIKSFNFTMSELGYSKRSGAKIRSSVGWGDANLLKPFVLPADLPQALDIYRKHHIRSLKKNVKLMRHSKDVLLCLKRKGIKLAIASNRPTRFTHIILRQLNIQSVFDRVLCSDKLKFGKPHPLILNALVKSFNIPKKDVVYVGDMAIDVRAGKKAGIDTIAVATGSSNISELKRSRPAFLIKDLNVLKQCCLKHGPRLADKP